jgi:hypothetical protein
VQIVLTVRSDGAKSEHYILFEDGQNSYWNFPADKTGLWWQCCLSYTGFEWYVSGLNNLKVGVKVFRTIQEAVSLNLPKCRHNRKCPWNKIVHKLSEWCQMN